MRFLPALAVALRRAKERLRHKHTVIRACISQAGYHVEPFMRRSVSRFLTPSQLH
jgi:hypothetical protein